MLSIASEPVDGRQRVVAIAVIFGLAAISIVALPYAAVPAPRAPGLQPALLGIAFFGYFITGYLLLSQFQASRLVGTAILGCAYLGAGLIACSYVLTFPGLFPFTIQPGASYWLWAVWHVEFALAVLAALIADRAKWSVPDRATAARWTLPMLLVTLAIVAFLVGIVVANAGPLSSNVQGEVYRTLARAAAGEVIVLTNVVVLALAVAWTQGRTVLQTWLIVALAAAVLDVQVTLTAGERYTVGWYLARLLVIVSSTAVLSAYLRQMHVLFAKLSDLSMVDGLTGLPNRRFFEERLDAAIRSAHRTHRPLALLLADVDGFKQFNDTYGHLAGDEALKAVASAMRAATLRPGDVVARWGGEEFVAVLPETDRDGACMVAERLRSSVESLLIAHRRAPTPHGVVTLCVGVAMLGESDAGVDALTARADAALYRAKRDGRNAVAVELAPDDASLPV
ncbi:MAG TPA: sensor domain-containing diguanylate cyclase [Candidatus Sulfotelmatobacter sp.]|nr:sensor domain-containing diguanylate cyclase [Candidatus Sulfotelmatobacter sp.]